MRSPNPELEKKIRKECLSLLLRKEPEEIGMREIATICGVSATTLYYYYRDKDSLFEAVKLDCLAEMDRAILERASRHTDPVQSLREGLSAFRDWAFENPRVSLLVMERLRANTHPTESELPHYYRSTEFARQLLDRAVAEGKARSIDTRLDSSVLISALWGTIEAVLLNRSLPDYWNKGYELTERVIDICWSAIFTGGKDEKNV